MVSNCESVILAALYTFISSLYFRCTVEEIDRVECPVMILQGEGDKLTPVEGAQQLHDKLKRSELHIVKVAGHQVRNCGCCYFPP